MESPLLVQFWNTLAPTLAENAGFDPVVTPPDCLPWSYRHPRIRAYIKTIVKHQQVLGLCEMSREFFDEIRRLYENSFYASKPGKSHGVALFLSSEVITQRSQILENSLVAAIRVEATYQDWPLSFTVVHLKAKDASQVRKEQMKQVLALGHSDFLMGDFNCEYEEARSLAGPGYCDTGPGAFTTYKRKVGNEWCAGGEVKRQIDHIFVSDRHPKDSDGRKHIYALTMFGFENDPHLPNYKWPSDHIPVSGIYYPPGC